MPVEHRYLATIAVTGDYQGYMRPGSVHLHSLPADHHSIDRHTHVTGSDLLVLIVYGE